MISNENKATAPRWIICDVVPHTSGPLKWRRGFGSCSGDTVFSFSEVDPSHHGSCAHRNKHPPSTGIHGAAEQTPERSCVSCAWEKMAPAAERGCILLIFYYLWQVFGHGSGTNTPSLQL